MPANSPHILVCDPIDEAGLALLRGCVEVEARPGLAPAELLEIVPDFDALVVRSATEVTAEVIAAGRRLSAVARAGSGLDNIDVEAARAAGVRVYNCPDANTLAAAELTLALMLALARNLPEAVNSLRAGRWERGRLAGINLHAKTLGIVGFGRIGREVAGRAQAFGMRVLTNQRRPTSELALAERVNNLDLDDLLARADFVSLHAPLTEETAGMIGAAQLGRMRPTAYLINTARGGLIDEPALLAALDAGQLAGAALDVFAAEPASD
ncbi:MAG: hydroxyacid dehydrogenase, partial [Candidatus Promineifilaceae bacterium]